MKKTTKFHVFDCYIPVLKVFLTILITFLICFGIIGAILFPSERDSYINNCRTFETDWTQILDDGSKTPVQLPGTLKAEWGEVVTICTTIPSEITAGENLCFRPIWQDVNIYIDGELRLHYNTENTRPFGTNSPMRYLFVPLEPSDAGKELVYQFSSNSKYAGNMQESYIGDPLSIWLSLATKSGLRTIIAALLLLLSLFCVVVCFILRFAYKKTLSLTYLAISIFFGAFWMLSEIEFRQIISPNISILSCYAYWSLMIIPFPLLLYLNEIQEERYQRVYFLPILYSAIMFVTGTVLQILDIVQFVQQTLYIHIGLLFAILCVIATITIDFVKRKIRDYLLVGIGIYGMLLTAILEIIYYYNGLSHTLGTVLAIGLLFLLIMAIIKTGQDMFRSEKKKQQAITAREAQAKFLTNMSHEIRTPINAIIGMNEMILRENENETIKDYALNIQNASNMLLGLINDVLDFSKIESGQLELVENTYHVASLLQDESLMLNARAADKPISTQITADANLPSKLFGDELRIKQILTNLLSNAVKYTPRGLVTLNVSSKPLDNNQIELCFSVTDTGIGIRKENLSQLFDSFKRFDLDKNRGIQGTGLGLDITKQLVDLMHGSITVDSKYGKGSTFTVTIPQKVIDAQPIGDLETAIQALKKEKGTSANCAFIAPEATVLVVDDTTVNLALMKGLLKRTKVKVDTASSGKKCLELTKENKYDVIFMDHMMPEMDGVETLEKIRNDNANPNRDTLIVALTANAIAGCKEMYLGYGFNDYFAKPVQADKLEDFLMKHLPNKLISPPET